MKSITSAYAEFKNLELDKFKTTYKTCEVLRQEFVKKFPKQHLSLMEKDDYVIGRTNELETESFCYWIETKLRDLGSIKGGSAEKFGIFYSQDKKDYVTTKRWSSSFNCDEAFLKIKSEISNLLLVGETKDFDKIEASPLPEMLKHKILTTYFPNDYISIFATDHVDFFCFELNIEIADNDTYAVKHDKILQYKNSHEEFSKLNNYLFMRLLYFWYRPYMRSIRILPMSAKIEFPNMTIKEVQTSFFQELINRNGKYQYRTKGLSTYDYTYVLFQFRNSIIASAKLSKIEKYDIKQGDYSGYYQFDSSTIKIFEPITCEELKSVDETFKGFSQATTFIKTSRQARLMDLIVSKTNFSIPEEISSPETLTEGAKKQITVNAYERSSEARSKCLEAHGYKCTICGFDFGQFYGSQFEGKIHVHHKKPLHEIDKEYKIDPINDLVPVCPNCHMVLHSKVGGCYTVEEVQKFRISNQ